MNSNKPVHAKNVPTNTSPSLSRGQVSHEQIAARAETIWRDRNSPHDQDDAIWLEAETQLKAEAQSKPVAGTASRPYDDEPGTPLRSGTKSRDPADAAAQTRSGTDAQAKKSAGKLRNQ